MLEVFVCFPEGGKLFSCDNMHESDVNHVADSVLTCYVKLVAPENRATGVYLSSQFGDQGKRITYYRFLGTNMFQEEVANLLHIRNTIFQDRQE